MIRSLICLLITNLSGSFIKDSIILKIHHNCKPCFDSECGHYEGNGDLVLELPGGSCKKYKIKEGDEVELV